MLDRSAIVFGILMLLFVSSGVAQPKAYIHCEAVLSDYQARFLWGASIEDGIADYIVPLATFTVHAPERYASRIVKIVFPGATGEVITVSEDDLGEQYSLAMPEDYFAGADGHIILSTSLLSIQRQERP